MLSKSSLVQENLPERVVTFKMLIDCTLLELPEGYQYEWTEVRDCILNEYSHKIAITHIVPDDDSEADSTGKMIFLYS